MLKLIQPGRIIFALGIIALGVLQFFARDYVLGRPPALAWPAWAAAMPGKLAWAYLSGVLVIIAGLAIIFNKKAGLAAIFIAVLFFVYSFLFRHLTAMSDLGNSFKSLALGAGALIIAASLMEKRPALGNTSLNQNFIFTGCLFIPLFFFWSGIAHFKFDEFVFTFIPAYIPAHPFWTYFCGIALLAGGIGIIFPQIRKLAAALSGLMILLWFILLHIPRAYQAPKDFTEWMGYLNPLVLAGYCLFWLVCLQKKKLRKKIQDLLANEKGSHPEFTVK